ncbi:MAG: S1/P1 nuclease [Alistipes sp.]|nr:S1/P1 nuclease [Alistipes sp.]
MRKLLLLAACLSALSEAWGWGQKGHDVVACVAECRLTPEAATRVADLLDGYSMVYWANWLDSASHTPEMAYTKTWHYANVDEGFTFETMPKNPAGDVVEAIERIVAALKSGELSRDEERLHLKMLIHLVGDLHCPMHAGRLSDRGGNSVAVRFFEEATDLHTLWDTALPEAAHRWSYSEWQNQLDRLPEETVSEIQAGTPRRWFEQTQTACRDIYARTPAGSALSYDYVAHYTPLVERQLLHGGLRLAALLNEIYG